MDEFYAENSAEQALIARAAARQAPVNGSMELSPLCNMDCRMCYVRRTPAEVQQGGGLHTAEEWLALGRQMADAGVLFLLLTGGEPLLFPGFRKLYCGLRAMGMLLTVNTNGTLIDEEWADFFAQNPPRRINITLYGASDAAYARLCRHPGGFAKTVDGIRRLKQRGVQVKINGSATRDNLADLDELYEIGKMLDAPVAVDTYMLPGLRERDMPYEQQSRLMPRDAALARWRVMQADYPPDVLRIQVRRLLQATSLPEPHWPDCITCLAANCSFTVNWQGLMRPCVMLEEPSVPVFETGFAAAWQTVSRGTKAYRINPKCTSCRLRPLCPTCVASARLEAGAYDAVPDYLCTYAEELHAILLRQEEQWEREAPEAPAVPEEKKE